MIYLCSVSGLLILRHRYLPYFLVFDASNWFCKVVFVKKGLPKICQGGLQVENNILKTDPGPGPNFFLHLHSKLTYYTFLSALRMHEFFLPYLKHNY